MVSHRGKRREGEHRKYSGSLLETVFDVNVNGVIRFAIARARRVHLRFALVLLVAQERSLFGGDVEVFAFGSGRWWAEIELRPHDLLPLRLANLLPREDKLLTPCIRSFFEQQEDLRNVLWLIESDANNLLTRCCRDPLSCVRI
jgi:hypothetical protein